MLGEKLLTCNFYLVKDMMILLASFSGKLYSLKNHKNQIIIKEKGGIDGSISSQNSDIPNKWRHS